MRKYLHIIVALNIFTTSFFVLPIFAHASVTDGTILVPDQYAWGDNVGWVNFAATNGNVHITNAGLTGYIWDSVYGWINLNPTNAGVLNDGNGNLSGDAWSSGTGFINFSGVVINSSGKFTGAANGSLFGTLNFDCTNCSVITDYRPGISTSTPPTPSTTAGGFLDHPYYLGVTPTSTITVIINLLNPELTPIYIPPKNNHPKPTPPGVLPPLVASSTPVTPEVVASTSVVIIKESPQCSSLLLRYFPVIKTLLETLFTNINKGIQMIGKAMHINLALPTFVSDIFSRFDIWGSDILSSCALSQSPSQTKQSGILDYWVLFVPMFLW